MKAQRLAAVALSLTVALAAIPALGQLVQLTGGSSIDLQVRGTDNVVDFVPGTVSPLPSGDTLVATGPDADARATFAFSDTAFLITELDYSLGAANDTSSFAQLAGQVQFTPVVNVIWELEGAFSWQGDWANGMSLFARITDTATSDVVALHYYDSGGVMSAVSYTVGVGGGNVSNVVGPTTGTLQAGRQYLYEFGLAVDNNPYSPDLGTATGNLSLTFAVPEPAVYVLVGVGLLVLLRARSKK